jgi:hypothetical protein
VQDEMERRGVRMYTFLVGQPGILNRKTSFRQALFSRVGAQLVAAATIHF